MELSLPYVHGLLDMLSIVKLTGDSGRSGDVIATRPQRAVPDALALELSQAPNFERLCETLGYDPARSSDPRERAI